MAGVIGYYSVSVDPIFATVVKHHLSAHMLCTLSMLVPFDVNINWILLNSWLVIAKWTIIGSYWVSCSRIQRKTWGSDLFLKVIILVENNCRSLVCIIRTRTFDISWVCRNSLCYHRFTSFCSKSVDFIGFLYHVRPRLNCLMAVYLCLICKLIQMWWLICQISNMLRCIPISLFLLLLEASLFT